MIIWRGLGILVPVALIPAALLTDLIYGDLSERGANTLFFLIGALLCFFINIGVKKYRNATCEAIVVENKRTGKEKTVLAKQLTNKKTGDVFETIIEDTFFFVPIKFWPIIYIIIGACYY